MFKRFPAFHHPVTAPGPKAGFLFLLVPALFFFTGVFSQTGPSWDWQARSQRKDSGQYTIFFSVKVPPSWQLYAPQQDISGVASAQLDLQDSSIAISVPLADSGGATTIKNPLFDNQPFRVHEKQAGWSTTLKFQGEAPSRLMGTLHFTYGKGQEFYPLESFPFSVPLEGGITVDNRIRIETIDLAHPVNRVGMTENAREGTLWNIFFLGFLGGLVALLTPCVFPMIPLTVSFFTKKTGEDKGLGSAALYGFFIFLIYVAFSIPFHLIGKVSPTIYNDISTNIWLNLVFFIIFIVFAVSFFGYFEITLPSRFANSANAKQGTGMLGIFFMALTLAIVSFSCTGPILGTLLVGTASSGAWPLTAGLAGFGVALGLPFALFAMFPQWLQSLPRSGGWLTTVKVFLGFIELALALKFLSNADLVAHWGILPREVFFAIWILIGFGLFTYLMGWIRFPHDPQKPAISRTRRGFTVFILLFTLYLLPGVTNTKKANLSLVSGFPPPLCYSLYKNPVNCEEPLRDYDEALKRARSTGKPILVDFTGWACVNCRKMEENVWPKAKVHELMSKYILVSLYVDDKKKLPASRQFTYTAKDSSVRNIITVGDRWSAFQTENFDVSSQPWYVALSPDEKLLTTPVGYTPDADRFAVWLQSGLDGMKK